MNKPKQILCIFLSGLLMAGVLSGCGKDATESEDLAEKTDTSQSEKADMTGPDATPYAAQSVPHQFRASGSNITERDGGGVDVAVEERSGEERYSFQEEDLGFVDTMSGAFIKIGMSLDEIESLIGKPRYIDGQDNRFYSGIAIKYDGDMKAVRLVVAAGNMETGDSPERFVTSRGVKLGSSIEEFASVYGDEYNNPQEGGEDSSATRAVRYYTKNGDGYEYAGNDFTKLNGDTASIVSQFFIFSPETGGLSVISLQQGLDTM